MNLLLLGAVLLVLLLYTIPHNVLASVFGNLGIPCIGTSGAYYAGQQDAIYYRNNGLAFNDQPSCLTCNSQAYNDDFQRGYDQEWNQYQSSEQSTNVYVNNSPRASVNVGQSSDQQQNQGLSAQPVGVWILRTM